MVNARKVSEQDIINVHEDSSVNTSYALNYIYFFMITLIFNNNRQIMNELFIILQPIFIYTFSE